MSECLVTGARAGQYAASFAQGRTMPDVNGVCVKEELGRVFGLLEREGGESPVAIRKRLQEEMWDNAGIIRNEVGLKKALETIRELKGQRMGIRGKARRYNREWQEALAVANMLEVAEMIVRAALFRTESRGSHYRGDYPEQSDEEWLANVVIRKEGEIVTSKVPVREED